MTIRRVSLTVFLLVAAGACSSESLSDHAGGNWDDGSPSGAASIESVVPPSCMVPVDPAKSLFVTDPTVLARFSFERMMQTLVTSAGSSQTPLAVFQQWWDTNNVAKPSAQKRLGTHCDDDGGLVNGFPIECPRQEGVLSTRDPFSAGADHFSPVAVVNRFDLAPQTGANCGEYRVVFAKDSGLTQGSNRLLAIFEAVLPNPNPEIGIDGCAPVARFWDQLSAIGNVDAGTALADRIDQFYFTGLPGFEPVVRFDHYGNGGAGTGQIRANQFMANVLGQQWELRQYGLHRTGANLVVSLDAVANNPDPSLIAGTDARSVKFRNAFLDQVPVLAAANGVNAIRMVTAPQFNAGQSREQTPSDNYENANPSAAFLAAIEDRLPNDILSPFDILARATTQSCQGCHEGENGHDLGGIHWPSSNGFTQIDEHSHLSPALTATFLPFRKTVLETFLTAQCQPHTEEAADPTKTVSGNVVGAAN